MVVQDRYIQHVMSTSGPLSPTPQNSTSDLLHIADDVTEEDILFELVYEKRPLHSKADYK